MARFDERMCGEAFGLLSESERIALADLHDQIAFRAGYVAPMLSWVAASAAADGAVSVDEVRAWMSAQVAAWGVDVPCEYCNDGADWRTCTHR